MSDTPPPDIRRLPRWRNPLVIPGIILGFVLVTWIWVKVSYPYGPSHCCSIIIGSELRTYATNNGGWFPHGGATPEASLSFLCRSNVSLLELVRGKNIPLKVARAAWDKDGQLGPDSCGWNYVEGLRADDNPKLGLVWDKPLGLDHYGERQHGLAHEVIYVDGSTGLISLEKWRDFVITERAELDKLIAVRGTNNVPIRWTDETFLGTNNPAR